MQAEQAYGDLVDAIEREREAKSLEGARLEWERRGSGSAIQLPKEMSRREISLALKIMDTLQHSTDSRIAGWTPRAQQEFAFAAALLAGPNYESEPAEIQTVVQIVTLAATDVSLGGYTFDTLGKIEDARTDAKQVVINPEKSAFVTFTIEEEKMVNLWVDPQQTVGSPITYDVSLTLTGPHIPSAGYSSNKETNAGAGESISLKLLPGTYRLEIKDSTVYPPDGAVPGYTPAAKSVDIGVNIKPYQTQRIEGQISIEGRNVTMPIRMSVAEFKEVSPGVWERKEFGQDTISELDPNKPVWVIVHGWNNSEKTASMVELAHSLKSTGVQVVIVDWNEAANSLALGGADWTPAVGKWVANLLKNAGFEGSEVNAWGYSWGSFVTYAIGSNYGEINSILAMDSAADTFITNDFDSTQVNFKNVSKMSWAIESSPAGSNARALSADYSFTVDSGIARYLPDFRAHNFAVSLASALVQDSATRSAVGENSFFDPRKLANGTGPQLVSGNGELVTVEQDAYNALTLENEYWGSGWEGIIKVDTYESVDENGKTWIKAKPTKIEFKDQNGVTRVIELQLLNPDATIR